MRAKHYKANVEGKILTKLIIMKLNDILHFPLNILYLNMWDVENNVSKQINTTTLNFHKCKYCTIDPK